MTLVLFSSCGPTLNSESIYDIEGNEYHSVILNKQEWLTKNLKTTKFSNGDVITQSKSISDWIKSISEKEPSWCYYAFDSTSNIILYNYFCVIDERNIAINGWRIPRPQDFEKLEEFLDGFTRWSAGDKMKSKTGWDTAFYDNGIADMNGTNESLFNAKPVGFFGVYSGDSFLGKGSGTGWWTVSKQYPGTFFMLDELYADELVSEVDDELSYGLSIRLIKTD